MSHKIAENKHPSYKWAISWGGRTNGDSKAGLSYLITGFGNGNVKAEMEFYMKATPVPRMW